MVAYVFRRLGILLVILFGSSFILYNLAAISNDPLQDLRLSTDPNKAYLILNLTRELQLDVPPPIRYFLWLKGLAGIFTGSLNFGLTRGHVPVTSELAHAIPVTIRLVLAATIIAIVLGIMIGIVTALRQYSKFDYFVTFISFLMFSLPIFWVAVLLKEYLAISFNNFLASPKVPFSWLIGLSLVSGLFWSSIIGGERNRFLRMFGSFAIASAVLLKVMDLVGWFTNPRLGPILVTLISIGFAFGVTQLSVGLTNTRARNASLTMSALTLLAYYPANYLFDHHINGYILMGLAVVTILVAGVVGFFFSNIDRGPIIRTTIITAFLSGFILVVDRLMRTWKPYMALDAINNRPVPTYSQQNDLLNSTNYWIVTLDSVVHLVLPTIALTLISFAGYVRYSRGTLLEVLNQDYIRTARAKGLNERTVIMRHAFRNTMIPLTTIMVVDFAGVIGGAIITESVFGWSGMGTLFRRGISDYDLNLLMGVFFVTATLAVLANLIADLLYSVLDPRIRVGAGA